MSLRFTVSLLYDPGSLPLNRRSNHNTNHLPHARNRCSHRAQYYNHCFGTDESQHVPLSIFSIFSVMQKECAIAHSLPASTVKRQHLSFCSAYAIIIFFVRKSDFLLYKMSYMLTGMMSDILHIHLFSLYCLMSVYSMF